MGDQLVAKPLTYIQTQKHTHTQTPNIHALNGIRTHDPGFRASEALDRSATVTGEELNNAICHSI
jgi:hypothetical protein